MGAGETLGAFRDRRDSGDRRERGAGSKQYPPGLVLGLLVYSYATGVFSSRQIERATYENVAMRLFCADTHPNHGTLCTFRRKNGPLLQDAFAQVLELAARCGVLHARQSQSLPPFQVRQAARVLESGNSL